MDPSPPFPNPFAEQAFWCRKLGSPFTAMVCELLGERLDRTTATGRRALDWPGDPGPQGDVVPLRLAGSLHALVRSGAAPALAALYPPHPEPDPARLWAAIEETVRAHDETLVRRLDIAPQTNEVGRSGAIMTGLLHLAHEFGLPFELFELGCSAGLNLNLGRFGYELGGVRAGDLDSPVRIAPKWDGPSPPRAKVAVAAAQGVDISPLDVREPAEREQLTAYVWADQLERLARISAAIDLALAHPPQVERGDAAQWLERKLEAPAKGRTRVVFHTIAYQYFPPAVQARIRRHLEDVGAKATREAPLAWLRLEADPEFGAAYSLRLTVWPGEERVLGLGHPHGRSFRHF